MVELASDLKGRYNVTILDGEDKGPQQLRAIRCICGMARASVYPAFPCIPRMPYGTISAVVLDCSLDKSTVRDGDSVLVPVRLPTHSALSDAARDVPTSTSKRPTRWTVLWTQLPEW
jgi:hypothetical protein